MSRSGYSEDYEHLELYRANVDRTIAGKRGQEFLKELAVAMDAMPVKILIAEELIDGNGDCCTIGVVCKSRGVDVSGVDCTCPSSVGSLVGISRILAAEIEFENDEGGAWRFNETPEARWQRMRKWVQSKIKE